MITKTGFWVIFFILLLSIHFMACSDSKGNNKNLKMNMDKNRPNADFGSSQTNSQKELNKKTDLKHSKTKDFNKVTALNGVWKKISGKRIQVNTDAKSIILSELNNDAESIFQSYKGNWSTKDAKAFSFTPKPTTMELKGIIEDEKTIKIYREEANRLGNISPTLIDTWVKVSDGHTAFLPKEMDDKENSLDDKKKPPVRKDNEAVDKKSKPEIKINKDLADVQAMLKSFKKNYTLEELSSIKSLNLSKTKITNKDLLLISKLITLTDLDISLCKKLDAHSPKEFLELQKLKNLRYLNVIGVKHVISEAVDDFIPIFYDLKTALPNCKIKSDLDS